MCSAQQASVVANGLAGIHQAEGQTSGAPYLGRCQKNLQLQPADPFDLRGVKVEPRSGVRLDLHLERTSRFEVEN